jgi:hypothetical protein
LDVEDEVVAEEMSSDGCLAERQVEDWKTSLQSPSKKAN